MDSQRDFFDGEREPERDAAAEAFTTLGERVAGMEERMERRMEMLTRAVEHVAIEKQSIEIPDYTPTLAKMNGILADITKRMKAVEEAPAMQMTPEALGQRMQTAAEQARRDDKATLQQATYAHDAASRGLKELHGAVLTIQQQRRRLIEVAGGAVLAGCLLWSFLPGVLARALPADWHLPERLAARTLNAASVWSAGTQMMEADNPKGWQEIVKAYEMRRQNQKALSACEQAAGKAGEAVRCTITVGKPQA